MDLFASSQTAQFRTWGTITTLVLSKESACLELLTQ